MTWISSSSIFSRGQLGRGLLVEEQGPEVVPALEGIRIQAVAAGGWHSAGISGEKRKENFSAVYNTSNSKWFKGH